MDKVTAAYLFLNVYQLYGGENLTAEEIGYEGESAFVRAAVLKCEAVSQRITQLVDFSKYDGVFYYEEADRNDDTSLASVIYKSLKGEEDGVDEWIKSTLKSCLIAPFFTKDDYRSGRYSHHEYYLGIAAKANVGFHSRHVARFRQSTDPSLNDITLGWWDIEASLRKHALTRAFKEAGDFYSDAGAVCALKAYARSCCKEEN